MEKSSARSSRHFSLSCKRTECSVRHRNTTPARASLRHYGNELAGDGPSPHTASRSLQLLHVPAGRTKFYWMRNKGDEFDNYKRRRKTNRCRVAFFVIWCRFDGRRRDCKAHAAEYSQK